MEMCEVEKVLQIFVKYLLEEANPRVKILVNKHYDWSYKNEVDSNKYTKTFFENRGGDCCEKIAFEHGNSFESLNIGYGHRGYNITLNDVKTTTINSVNRNTNNICNNNDDKNHEPARERNASKNLELRRQLRAHLKDQKEALKKEVCHKNSYGHQHEKAVLKNEKRNFKLKQKKWTSLVTVNYFFIFFIC